MSELSLLPASMYASLALLPSPDTPVILLTRHSVRELGKGLGLASNELQLTEQGRLLAYHWGKYLNENTRRDMGLSVSSPIQRCLDTAVLMHWGAMQNAYPSFEEQCQQFEQLSDQTTRHHLLVEPGSFVLDHAVASPYFKSLGAVNFIDAFVKNQLQGMKHPVEGVLDILQYLFQVYGEMCDSQPRQNLKVMVSHDTILSAILAVISQQFSMDTVRWPEMMEGILLWFEPHDDFARSELFWLWRGQQHRMAISQLIKSKQY
ncbi:MULTISPECIES: histidine phosphatase family protein [unclassified Acinetobacter]|uniref:histidine phosphatase family protein n=1 Tax=unclassified Acinetobacter TaxID=196816 RepID=UPI0035B6B6E7